MRTRALRYALGAAGLALASHAAADITIYEHDGFDGRSFASRKQVGNLEKFGFNDRASSAVVTRDRWEMCEGARFSGRCVVLRPGRYPSFAAMGLNDRASSMRVVGSKVRVEESRYGPQPVGDFRRRRDERLFEAEVTSVRAVVGPPQERCWAERERISSDRSEANIPAAIAGALIGGILGHQVGSGRGNDLATAGGAVAGAAIGANAGRDRSGPPYSDFSGTRRCETVRSDARPEFWEVTYVFRDRQHIVQMAVPPGRTVTVNAQGEPRA